MIRLFLTPHFSPVNMLMQCTPWVSVKVTPERDVVAVGLIQRILTFGLCLLFWKTLLPLTIGFALWYQFHEGHNAKIQDEVERVEKNPDLLSSIELLPETKACLVERRHIPPALHLRHLPIGNLTLDGNEDLCTEFTTLPQERQLAIAQSNDTNRLWALGLNPSLAKDLGCNPFEENSVIAAAAFEKLSIDELKESVRQSETLYSFLEDSKSYLAVAIKASSDRERLAVFAEKYPDLILWLLPERAWDQLGDGPEIASAKQRFEKQRATLRIENLQKALSEGPMDIFESDPPLIPTLFRQCNSDQRQYLLQSIALNPDALRQLPMGSKPTCFDFSFVPDDWFENTYPQLSPELRRLILFSTEGNSYINRDRILKHTPLNSWIEFATFPSPVAVPATPQKGTSLRQLDALAQTASPDKVSLIQQMPLAHFQEIFKDWRGDSFELMQLVTGQPDKVCWLIQTKNLSPVMCGDHLSSWGISQETVMQIAKGLKNSEDQNILLLAFHKSSPLEGITNKQPTSNGGVATSESEPDEAPVEKSIVDYLQGLEATERKDLYSELTNPKTSQAAIDRLKAKKGHQIPAVVHTFLANVAWGALEHLAGPALSSSPGCDRGPFTNGALHTRHPELTAENLIPLLLSACAMDEMPALCAVAPAPVLRYLALSDESADTFTSCMNSLTPEKLTQEDCEALGRLLVARQKHAEITALAQQVELQSLVPNSSERQALLDALPLDPFKQLVLKLTDETMHRVLNFSDFEKVKALFEARPEESLKIGGAAVADKVRGTETWRSLTPEVLLKYLPISVILGEPIDKDRLQTLLRARPDDPGFDILQALKTKEQIDWALEVLNEEAKSALVTLKITPTNIDSAKASINPREESDAMRSLRRALLEEYAHMIPVASISSRLLCNDPERALCALKNPHLSDEQRAAFIRLGAASEVVARYICDKPGDVKRYARDINSLNSCQLWVVTEQSNAAATLTLLEAFETPIDFPMPKSPEQWRFALKVEAFRTKIDSLIGRWKLLQPGPYEQQIQQMGEENKAELCAALRAIRSSYAGNRYAEELFPQQPPSPYPNTPAPDRCRATAQQLHDLASCILSPNVRRVTHHSISNSGSPDNFFAFASLSPAESKQTPNSSGAWPSTPRWNGQGETPERGNPEMASPIDPFRRKYGPPKPSPLGPKSPFTQVT